MTFSTVRLLLLLVVGLTGGCVATGSGEPDELRLFDQTYKRIAPAESDFLGTHIAPANTSLLVYEYQDDEWHSIKGEQVHGYFYFQDKRRMDGFFKRPDEYRYVNWRFLFEGLRFGETSAMQFTRDMNVESEQGVDYEKLLYPGDCYAFVIVRAPAQDEKYGTIYKAFGKGVLCGLSKNQMIASVSSVTLR